MTATDLSEDPTLSQRTILARERAGTTQGFTPDILPGATQIQEYARTMITASVRFADPASVERMLEMRMRRHGELLNGTRAQRTYIITEPALTHGLVDEAVMDAQLTHLRRVSGLEHVDLRLLPADNTEPWTVGFVIRDGLVSLV